MSSGVGRCFVNRVKCQLQTAGEGRTVTGITVLNTTPQGRNTPQNTLPAFRLWEPTQGTAGIIVLTLPPKGETLPKTKNTLPEGPVKYSQDHSSSSQDSTVEVSLSSEFCDL